MKVICRGHKKCEYSHCNDHCDPCRHSIPHECDDLDYNSEKFFDCNCSEIFLRKEKLEKIQKINESNL